ncbi:hypothetical protein GLW04_03305 [Halobacillus litoralis]|uniref:Uncharacterized protein n=1 Tax=Halobacillus litoralis TaxID=45668 RepID=A0A845DMR9_9BACI|nr:hypothetical protein [Halobacillus litoralis]MYL18901.1 hypothetical protein [Halobacillus litoralis]MYL39624.1 hypothetical protein [Halobacillus litoralis]
MRHLLPVILVMAAIGLLIKVMNIFPAGYTVFIGVVSIFLMYDAVKAWKDRSFIKAVSKMLMSMLLFMMMVTRVS